MTMGATHVADRLADAMDGAGSPVCVGLDPVLERLPEQVRAEHWEPTRAISAFCRGVIDAVAPSVGIVKPQSACFERYGAPGVQALERVIEHARERGLAVILDAKRGDIGVSAEHYAAAALHMGAHAITVNAYLGPSTVEPYLDAGLGVFVLVRTSNRDSDLVQARELADGGTVAEMMASQVEALGRGRCGERGLSGVGAVVGATKASDGRALRAIMADQPFLVPGYGAQGGTAEDIRAMLRPGATTPGESGVVVNASRSVIFPGAPGDWRDAVARAASGFAADVRAVLG
jgi:orotidine-5'-phosphate decarboxylase